MVNGYGLCQAHEYGDQPGLLILQEDNRSGMRPRMLGDINPFDPNWNGRLHALTFSAHIIKLQRS
jgi:hypothetical protein